MRWFAALQRIVLPAGGIWLIGLAIATAAEEEPTLAELLESIRPPSVAAPMPVAAPIHQPRGLSRTRAAKGREDAPRTLRPGTVAPNANATNAGTRSPNSRVVDPRNPISSLALSRSSQTRNRSSRRELLHVPGPEAKQVSALTPEQLWGVRPKDLPAYRALSQNGAASGSASVCIPATGSFHSGSPMIEALNKLRYPTVTVSHTQPAKPSTKSADGPRLASSSSAAAHQDNEQPPLAPGVAAHLQYADDLLDRGAVHAAEAEYVETLWSLAVANDAASETEAHSDGLRLAMQASKEANDYLPWVRQANSQLEVSRVALEHKSILARQVVKQRMDAVSAMQLYLDFAKGKLVEANEPIHSCRAASLALLGMSRAKRAQSSAASTGQSIGGAKAIAWLLAAYQLQPNDPDISNELGVLYANFGDTKNAERMLKNSLIASQRPETWQNLATVWNQRGKSELAKYAHQRAHQLYQRPGPQRTSPDPIDVPVLTQSQFAAASGPVGVLVPAPQQNAVVHTSATVPVAPARAVFHARPTSVNSVTAARSHVSTNQPLGDSNWTQRLFATKVVGSAKTPVSQPTATVP